MIERPGFLVIGAMKAGTTSLAHYLASHPEIYVPEGKELHFFSRDDVWSRGPSWYLQQFGDADDGRVAGEASPSYSAHPLYADVPARVAELIPEVRLIYLIREPIARMRSHYAHRRLRGRETRSIATALLDDPRYVAESSYALQLEQYLPHFPADRVLVIEAADLFDHRQQTMRHVFLFLGVDADWESHVWHEELNVTARGHPRQAIKRLSRTPGYAFSRRLARAVLSDRALGRMGYRTVDPGELALDPDVEAELRSRIAPDQTALQRLLPRLGPKASA